MNFNPFHPLAVTLLAVAFAAAGCATARKSVPPPTVTAKAWAIADGKTGRLLWGFNADTPCKSASTTKMMCAFVILQLAAREPAVMDETVTFSKLADATAGTTSGIKAGESVPVRDCLYGLLLPSGNDAGNALAEHFNSRFAPPDQAMLAVAKWHASQTQVAMCRPRFTVVSRADLTRRR